MKHIGIGWGLNSTTGWGVYGTNLALQLNRLPGVRPVLLEPSIPPVYPVHAYLLAPLFLRLSEVSRLLAERPTGHLVFDFPVLAALGNDLKRISPARVFGKTNVGVVFLEHAELSDMGLERSSHYNLIVAGSTWNAEILRAHGIEQTRLVYQGVDTSLFFPAEPSGLLANRFVIFSGGKLEYRKGQDVVVAAFKAFRERHPEALLVVAWHNYWSEKMAGLERTGNVVGLPPLTEQRYPRVGDWLRANGLPDEAFLDLGALPNAWMPHVLREANVALFPNRCEGGTNLVAMECFACAVPTILSANTGHLDLIAEERCYPLRGSRPVTYRRPTRRCYDGWGEPDVEEVVEALEQVYAHPDEACRRADAARRFIEEWSWENQTRQLLAVLEPYLS